MRPRARAARARPTRAAPARTSSGCSSCAPQLRARRTRERLGAPPEDVALTSSTSDGIARVVAGLGLGAGDEIVTSDTEHPGALRPADRRARRAASTVRAVAARRRAPTPSGRRRRLVACSHVELDHRRGRARPSPGSTSRSLLDGAQGVGAIAGRRRARWAATSTPARARSGCAGRRARGCSGSPPPGATGSRRPAPGYLNLADPGAGPGRRAVARRARRYDAPAIPLEASSRRARRATRSWRSSGWAAVHARAPRWPPGSPTSLRRARPRRSRPRGDDHARRLGGRGRRRPTRDAPRRARASSSATCRARRSLRASVGAWNDESDLERLLAAL